MKILLGVVSAILLIIFIGAFLASYIYQKEEVEAYKRMSANCEIMEIAILFDSYYKNNGKYPKVSSFIESLGENINKLGCGHSPSILNGKLLDPFNEPYCYVVFSDQEAVIYSRNVTYIDYNHVTENYKGFKLDHGDFVKEVVIKKILIAKSDQLNS